MRRILFEQSHISNHSIITTPETRGLLIQNPQQEIRNIYLIATHALHQLLPGGCQKEVHLPFIALSKNPLYEPFVLHGLDHFGSI